MSETESNKASQSGYQLRSSGRSIPFPDETLFASGPQKTYSGQHLNEIAFPLGGIGSGCISLSGRGELVDWEIFNRPNKGYRPDYSFFTLFAQAEGQEPVFRVLEGRLPPPYQGRISGAQVFKGWGFGPPLQWGSGLVRMADCQFTGMFPFCRLDMSDPAVPVKVSTTAWSPFIPLDDRNSSLPVAIFDITLTNTSASSVRSTVALGLQNVIGYPEIGQSTNEWIEGNGYHGILMSTQKHETTSLNYGSLALLSADDDVTWQLRFGATTWFEASESLIDEIGTTGEFGGPKEPCVSLAGQGDVAQLGIKVSLAPGESVTRTFVLAWMVPNFEKYWLSFEVRSENRAGAVWPTYQSQLWRDAGDVGRYTLENLDTLRNRSRQFADSFFSSTIPAYVLDAISSGLSVLRTPTVTRLTDGTLYGFEGCHALEGCCEGSCTHVWSYTQAVPYLFPQLERQMREAEFQVDLRDSDGHMQFRIELPFGTLGNHKFYAAADGQMGCVLRAHREWLISGDDGWLRKIWPYAKKALEYSWVEWDTDKDGLMEGPHHNTLDIEFHGPETMCGSMYLAALLAGEEMARYLEDEFSARKYRRVFESGSKLSDQTLFNGEFYEQKITPGDNAPYQFGPGLVCGQMIGQWHARMSGLGDLYNPEHIRSAVAALYKHNFRDNFAEHHNPHRVYALNDDQGLLICTWPRGGRPKRSMPYSFECQVGYEYQEGAEMIYEGFLREGLMVCKAIRDRHDGLKRNPYNEFECGNHYARSMASYSYLLALSGFRYHAPRQTLYLNPAINSAAFHCFFSVEGGWGTIFLSGVGHEAEIRIDVLSGKLALKRLVVCGQEWALEHALVVAGEPWTVSRTD
jgi:non-lysosomal glucosylceramidase